MITTFITVLAWAFIAIFILAFSVDIYLAVYGDWFQRQRAMAPFKGWVLLAFLASVAWIITTFIA